MSHGFLDLNAVRRRKHVTFNGKRSELLPINRESVKRLQAIQRLPIENQALAMYDLVATHLPAFTESEVRSMSLAQLLAVIKMLEAPTIPMSPAAVGSRNSSAKRN